MDFSYELNTRTSEVENIIKSFLPVENGLQKTVISAMNYSVLAGGKRLRPMLMQETFKQFGGSGKVIEPFMAAIEMIHTYSLVHDDLPAMDNDEYRRGKKTTHAVYGETMGILAGDGLLNFAFETATKAFDTAVDTNVANALKILACKAGIYGMIGGQVADIESEGKNVGIDTICFIHKNKTAALIEASMLIGAVLAGANEKELEQIEKAATNIGFAFQIQDDILDITSTTEVLGKPVGSDDKNQKSTYVAIKGLTQSKLDVKCLSEEAIAILRSFKKRNIFLEELVEMLISRNK